MESTQNLARRPPELPLKPTSRIVPLQSFAFTPAIQSLQNLNRNRFYRPDIGRFLSADKMNDSKYVYVGNDPIRYIDAQGLTRGAPGVGFTTFCENKYRYTGALSEGLDCNTSDHFNHTGRPGCGSIESPWLKICYQELFWDMAAASASPTAQTDFEEQFKRACDKVPGRTNCTVLRSGGMFCSCCKQYDCCPTPPPSR